MGSSAHGNEVRKGNDWPDLELGPIDWCALVQSMGWRTARVQNLDEFTKAFAQAIAANAPFLIDALVDPQARPPLNLFSSIPPLAVIGP